ncbi:MAG: TraM recognition domain-containing protein [Pseudomonadota bacterium]
MQNADEIDLPISITDEGELIRNPYPNLPVLVLGATGSGKNTASVMPTAQALFGYPDIAVYHNDPKRGESYAQLRGVAQQTGRSLGCIDDFGEYGFDNPDRFNLNPFGWLLSTLKYEPAKLNFAIETASYIFLEEIDDGRRNFVFREKPRRVLQLGMRFLAEFKPDLLTPGGLSDLISDPYTWRSAREIAAGEGSTALKARARSSLDLEEQYPDDYFRHYEAAISELAPYEAGSVLNTAGANADITHEQLCRDGWYVCGVLPPEHAQRVAVHTALHQQSFLAAQFSGRGGTLYCIVDEMNNSPQRKAIEATTIQRSSKISNLWAAQSYEDIERQYGKKLAKVLADSCPVHIYLSFSYEDAERVSKRWGEEISIQRSVNANASQLEVSGSMSMGKQAAMTMDELVTLDPAYQVVYIRGVGHFVCPKLFQNQIAPTCHWLSPNPQEGGVLPPDPKIELPVHYGEAS